MKQKTRIFIYILIAIAVVIMGTLAILGNNNADTTVSAQEHIDLGRIYLVELSYEKAVLEFAEAIEIEPLNADAYLGLAEAYVGMGDTEKAIEVLEEGYGKTRDERLRDMLEELIPSKVEDTSVITNFNADEVYFEQENTVEFYIPNELIVYKKSGIPNYFFHLKTKYNDYAISISSNSEFTLIDSNIFSMENPDIYISTWCNPFSELCYVESTDEYFELEYAESDNIKINSGHHICSMNSSDWNEPVLRINKDLLTASNSAEDWKYNRIPITGGYNDEIGYLLYDDEGNLIESQYDNETAFYKYDENWNLTKIEIYRENHKGEQQLDEEIQYIYENGLVVQIISKNYSNHYQNYEYDLNGRKISETKYERDKQIWKNTYAYDNVGNITQIKRYNSNNELYESIDIKYSIVQVNEKSILAVEDKYKCKFNR